MDREMTFSIFKNIIIEQNKLLLRRVSEITGLKEEYLQEKYLKPDYYLPIIVKETTIQCPTKNTKK
jgi:hypothetical protein